MFWRHLGISASGSQLDEFGYDEDQRGSRDDGGQTGDNEFGSFGDFHFDDGLKRGRSAQSKDSTQARRRFETTVANAESVEIRLSIE